MLAKLKYIALSIIMIISFSISPKAFAADEIAVVRLADIVYSEDINTFVTGGRYGNVFSSANGDVWVRRTNVTSKELGGSRGRKCLLYSKNLKKFIGATTDKSLIVSDDSVNWSIIEPAAFTENVTTVSEAGEYIFVTDEKANIYRAHYSDIENFTLLEQSYKTDGSNWRGGYGYGNKVVFYSTRSWENSSVIIEYDITTEQFREIPVEKNATTDIERFCDITYSDTLQTLVLCYCVSGNSYKDSYLAVYEDGVFKTKGSVIPYGFSIIEGDGCFIIGSITGPLYRLSSDRILDFTSDDLVDITPSGLPSDDRVYNFASGGGKIIGVTNLGNIITIKSDGSDVAIVNTAHKTVELTSADIFGKTGDIRREAGEDITLTYTCYPTDQAGVMYGSEPMEVTWGIELTEPASETVTIDKDGVLTIPALEEYGDIDITIYAESAEGGRISKSVRALKPIIPSYVEISGEDSCIIPATKDSSQYSYTAVVYDTDGRKLDGASLTYSVEPSENVTYDNGVLTVYKEAQEGSYTLTVSALYKNSPEIFSSKDITLVQQLVPAKIELDDSIRFIPDETEAEYDLDIKVYDNKGSLMSGAVESIEITESEFVSLRDGKLYVSPDTQDMTVSVGVKCDGLEASFDISLIKPVIAITGDDSITVKEGKEDEISFTASVTDASGNAVDAPVQWSVKDGNAGNIDESGKLSIPSWIEDDTVINIIASCGKYNSAVKQLTVNVKSGSSSSGGGGGGGGSSSSSRRSVAVSGAPAVQLPEKIEAVPEVKAEPSFSDMSAHQWAAEAVEALCADGIVSGSGNGEFYPQREVTRAEFVKMIMGLIGYEHSVSENPFNDVNEENVFYDYIMAAYEKGIVNGVSENTFDCDAKISRQDMAKILHGAMMYAEIEAEGEKQPADFDSVDEYAREAVSKLLGSGIITGYPDGSFVPKRSATRAEAAVMIYRLKGMM